MAATDHRLIVLAPEDTVAVVRCAIDKGETLMLDGILRPMTQAFSMGHKVAIRPMEVGAKVIKYGVPIGSVTCVIAVGEHVHLHNMKSDYTPTYSLIDAQEEHGT